MQNLESLLCPEIKIQNVVCTADLKQKIDITSFNEYEFLRSNLDLYTCGYVKDDTMVGNTTVFASGKLISVGTKSRKQAINELNKTKKILQKYNLIKTVRIEPKVQNIVARFDFKKRLPIIKLAKTLPRSIYEPDQFPAIIFRIPNTCSILIFASGKGVLAGAKTIEDLNAAIFELKQYLKKFL
ncbi:TATA-box-binding protein [Marine Group I thaumarchaeote SCGC AAA799-E16]|uniref:TATA-box-binding protein n=2 Tax=Marine Group I TaxID=905826 RepID=A0A087RVX5_9ARCH|nr:TATA-box-binding protein [Marine Group I thaumarchaeote SCGC AAA799-E16]KFM17629.1 TATA-box-binding protein [Marine Group I thaumarchaeote SCGC RSA3]